MAARAAVELPSTQTNSRIFILSGTIREIKPDGRTVVINHEAITDYMVTMTMPFIAANPSELTNLNAGDAVSFRLQVTPSESRVDHILRSAVAAKLPSPALPSIKKSAHPLRNFAFTNEFGQPVRLNDFHGQALAITFIFTRCPLPEFCPRVSKNFSEATQKLKSLTNSPTNWHFISVTFDPEFDSPERLKAYAESYGADSTHWSFLTGPTNEIAELAQQSGIVVEADGATLNHNFRTLIIDAAGRLQTTFPTSGDLTDAIVAEMLKASKATN